jgi:hypothetical protein
MPSCRPWRATRAMRDERERWDERDGGGLIWSIWSVSFVWLNQTDQINKRDQPVLALHAPWSVALAGLFQRPANTIDV